MKRRVTQYYRVATLDGFIADLDNTLDWLFTRKREENGRRGAQD